MSKLNVKVVDMENSVTELAKKVIQYASHHCSQLMRPSRTTVKSGSLQTRSRRISIRFKVGKSSLTVRPFMERDRREELWLPRCSPDQKLYILLLWR